MLRLACDRCHRLVFAALLALAAGCGETPLVARSTSLDAAACKPLPPADRARFDADVGVQECEGVDGWRVFLVSSDERSWLQFERGGMTWSAEQAIVYDEPIGLFPGVDDAAGLQWRVTSRGAAVAVIVPVTAQRDVETTARASQRLIVRLGASGICLLGRAESDREAVAVADGPGRCT